VSLQYSPVNGRLHQRDLHVFQAIRSMDEVLIANFMTFQDALDQGNYDLVEVRGFVPDLNRHLAACDVALVQGGLTTGMELTAAGTPFIYFPLRNHFEQKYHVAHRLDRYGAGRRMAFETSTPSMIADAIISALQTPVRHTPVEADGVARAARMLVDVL
jgi:UDP:flavonoid glycosyltransferase YjiC (YdhE family)